MKALARFLSILAGAFVFGGIVYVGGGRLGQWYEMNVARNDHDLSVMYLAGLVALFGAVVIGGWIGDALCRRGMRRGPRRL
jgi:hypothetical protein